MQDTQDLNFLASHTVKDQIVLELRHGPHAYAFQAGMPEGAGRAYCRHIGQASKGLLYGLNEVDGGSRLVTSDVVGMLCEVFLSVPL
jgi:hypothetical protein